MHQFRHFSQFKHFFNQMWSKFTALLVHLWKVRELFLTSLFHSRSDFFFAFGKFYKAWITNLSTIWVAGLEKQATCSLGTDLNVWTFIKSIADPIALFSLYHHWMRGLVRIFNFNNYINFANGESVIIYCYRGSFKNCTEFKKKKGCHQESKP